MAITAPTTLSGFSGFLNREQSAPIFEKTRRRSVVQSLVRQVPLGINGQAVPVTTGKLTAGWVSEGGSKPASAGTMGLKTMDPKKLAVIAVVSAEVVRANPGGFMGEIREQVAEAFAVAFDYAALYDYGPSGQGDSGGGPFSTFINQTTKTVEIGTGTDLHADFVSGLSLLVSDGKKLNGFALDDRIEPLLLDARDGADRPLYVDLPTGTADAPLGDGEARRGRLLQRPAYMGEGIYSGDTADIVAFGGDWRQAAWGSVGGISYRVSTEAPITINGTLVSAFEKNLVAVLAEAEFGFLVNDPESFVSFTNAS